MKEAAMRCVRILSVGAFLVCFLAAVSGRAEILVNVRLCPVAEQSPSDEAATLPTPLTEVSLGSSFFLEIWTMDVSVPPRGISAGYLDLAYGTDKLDVTGLDHGLTYTVFPSGAIDDSAGLVSDFGGNTLDGTPGKTEWARLGWLTVDATALGSATFTPQEASSGDGFARFQEDLPGGQVPWSQIDAPAACINVIPEPSSFVMLSAVTLVLASLGFLKRCREK
jgi:hypothetical protein